MFKEIFEQIKIASAMVLLFTLLTGILYPAVVTGLAQVFFPWRANGSLLANKGIIIGSELIGQSFSDPQYFWGRPSATTPFPYNGESSSGSNLGPSNPAFLNLVKSRMMDLSQSATEIPVDLVTASGSGLDPEISPWAAYFQVPRIAKVRKMSEKELQELIKTHIQNRTFGLLGEPRVNVLLLNLALDNRESSHAKTSKS
jgi:K+-transporting ATPase ATPase C chain